MYIHWRAECRCALVATSRSIRQDSLEIITSKAAFRMSTIPAGPSAHAKLVRRARHVALWLLGVALSAAVAYRLITGHFSVEGDDQEVLAMALTIPGIVLMVVVLLRER